MTGTRPDDRSLPSEPDLGDVEGVLRDLIADLEPVSTSRRGVGRPAVLPAMCLWGGMVVCVLRGCSSQLALWRLITQLGLWDYPRYALSDQAIYHRLARDGTTGLVTLYTQVSALLGERTPSKTGSGSPSPGLGAAGGATGAAPAPPRPSPRAVRDRHHRAR